MSVHLRDMMTRFDIWGTCGSVLKDTCIIHAEARLVDDKMVLWSPAGIGSASTSSGVLNYHEAFQLGSFPIRCETPLPNFEKCERIFIDGAIPLMDGDQLSWKIDSNSLIIPVGLPCPDRLHVLDLFSGGYGGWHVACSFLADVCHFPVQVVGVDSSLPAAFQHCISHGSVLVPGDGHLPAGIFRNCTHDFFIVGDAESCSWLPEVGLWRPDVVCISSPCPPWSCAGLGHGLHSADGRLMLRAIAICRLLQPSFICAEQVFSFASHEHMQFVMAVLSWAGYAVVWAKVADLADQGPVARSRWLCLARRIEDASVKKIPLLAHYFKDESDQVRL